ncbi:MAG: S-methyl-5-thioribose-1-phosphate isomerase, partial [Vulcanimicrobiaceae bacterium]
MPLEAVFWVETTGEEPAGVGYVDQRMLPAELVRRVARDADEVTEAIATLAVRGAPCIGVFAAYGIALARRLASDVGAFAAAAAKIRSARPTAVNLAWAVDRVLAAEGDLLAEARAIHGEQRAVDRALAAHGASLLGRAATVITHC